MSEIQIFDTHQKEITYYIFYKYTNIILIFVFFFEFRLFMNITYITASIQIFEYVVYTDFGFFNIFICLDLHAVCFPVLF